jgi:PiT family inorganic phosphate transporter
MFDLEPSMLVLLITCLVAVCIFEFINGFHDTANAVATVIYTKSLKPQIAVIYSGFLNFLGVLVGGIGVAMGILKLLPIDALLASGVNISVCVILATLISAIIWNLGTWYLGIPASSSHTLIGSILGAGIGFSLFINGNISGVNWEKAKEIGLSLLISPLFGFGIALLIMLLLRRLISHDAIFFKSPSSTVKTPTWIRSILIGSCGWVSFSHGQNDGQKGVGLTLLVLISIVPAQFALKPDTDIKDAQPIVVTLKNATAINTFGEEAAPFIGEIYKKSVKLDSLLHLKMAYTPIQKFDIRKQITAINKNIKELEKTNISTANANTLENIKKQGKTLNTYTDYAPRWVVLMISLALGIGTMIGWKRIVITLGEKIGKEHLVYAQGMTAELIAAATISASSALSLPVSTTHILSSGIAGTMAGTGGLQNLQSKTIRNILMAWLLTLPVCIGMGMGLFFIMKWLLV